MDNQQAKYILQAYRHGGQDASDPLFAEALEQARRDPELAQWLAEERAFDAAISQKLKHWPAPADLKAAILAGNNLTRPAFRWQRSTWLAAAAALVLTAMLAGLWFKPILDVRQASLERFQTEMAELMSQGTSLDVYLDRLSDVRQWLAKQHALTEFAVPASLEALPTWGCRFVQWRGRKVALICFRTVDRKVVHLFTIRRSDLPAAALTEQPQFAQVGEFSTVSWSRGDQIHFMMGQMDAASLKALF